MLIKILLLASLSASVLGQTVEDCKEMYQMCIKDANQQTVTDSQPQLNDNDVYQEAEAPPNTLEVRKNFDISSLLKSIFYRLINCLLKGLRRKPVRPVFYESVSRGCVEAHNKLRAQHGVPALIEAPLYSELNLYNNHRASDLATTDIFEIPIKSRFDENIIMGSQKGKLYNCEAAVQAWYELIRDSPSKDFMPLLSKETKSVKCAATKSPKTGFTYIVVS